MKQKTTKQRIEAVKKAFKEYHEFKPTREHCLKCRKESRKQAIEEFAKKMKKRITNLHDSCFLTMLVQLEILKKEMLSK